jgi:hypothetical protein
MAGPDGALWFTESNANKMGRITTAGVITEFPLSTGGSGNVVGITAGPDGAIWFTEENSSTCEIGRITIGGIITGFPLGSPATQPFACGGPFGISAGPDGAIWFTETAGGKIGRAALSSGSSSMAQLASGGGWTTTITLTNTGASPAQAVLSFLDNNGNPLQLPLTFPQGSYSPVTASTFTATITAGAELVVASTGSVSQSTQVGWAQLLTTGSLNGFAVFTQATGSSLQEAVVPLENRTPGAFVLSFDNSTGYATGVALANVATQSASVGVVIRDDAGTVLLTTSIVLPAQGHVSFNLVTNYPVTALHRGTVEFDTPSNGQISVLGLRFNPTGAFSSIPAMAK